MKPVNRLKTVTPTHVRLPMFLRIIKPKVRPNVDVRSSHNNKQVKKDGGITALILTEYFIYAAASLHAYLYTGSDI